MAAIPKVEVLVSISDDDLSVLADSFQVMALSLMYLDGEEIEPAKREELKLKARKTCMRLFGVASRCKATLAGVPGGF